MKVLGLLKFVIVLFIVPICLKAQDNGTLRGDLMVNSSFYINDPKLGQYGTTTPQYKIQKSSAEAWMFLNYNNKGYDFNIRYDLFHNSPLLNPQEAFNGQGVPFFNVNKTFDNITITVGSFYDQFGSGVLFRAYENRVIGVDFAMQGVKLEYNLKDKIRFKAFTGKQKYRFGQQPQVIQGFNMEGGHFGKISYTYGVSALKRTLDFVNDIQANIAPAINALKLEDRFVPRANVYGGQVYGSLTWKDFSLNIDVAAKTPEAVLNFKQKFVNKPGIYTTATLNYSTKGFGISLVGKYSDFFSMRTNPFTITSPVLVGTIGYLAPINRQNTYRLPARYSPSVQEWGEIAYTADINYSIDRNNVFNLNFTNINAPNVTDEKMFEEIYFTYQHNFGKAVKTIWGFQHVFYNQKYYQGKPQSTPNVKTKTPFFEILYKMKNKKSIHLELQYLRTKQDLGDFAWASFEYTIAPHYSFTFSDMVNTKPREETRNPNVAPGQLVHYPTLFFAYSYHQTRLTAGYIKQVEGIVCSGGVCRLQPAFSGFQFSLTTNF
ncbi:hypothetical protein GC194_06595 [bacterium]|nr:hypothetical protein [bacterium]